MGGYPPSSCGARPFYYINARGPCTMETLQEGTRCPMRDQG